MNHIGYQTAKDNSTINNAEQINYNIFDAPLKFYCDKKVQERPELKPVFQVLQFMVNKDNLRQRFGGANYKYDELAGFVGDSAGSRDEFRPDFLDDGYKSVIFCIAAVIRHFRMRENDNDLDTDEEYLLAEIVNTGLKLKYSSEVTTIKQYKQAKKRAEEIQKELAPCLNCATQYGNFFQFNNIYLEELTGAPFFTEDVKFSVSNEIIPNLIKPLYGDKPECGLREIIQNACDAMKELAALCGKKTGKPVEVYLLKETGGMNKLCVRDYGIGMTKDILLQKYFVIGESSKKDSPLNLVGQFGIGALAAFLLGDTVEVRTKPYGEKHLYHFFYSFSSNRESSINISIEEDSSFTHGTEVMVDLNGSLSKMGANQLINALKLDLWYRLPDVPIELYINGVRREIRCLRGSGHNWIKVKTPLEDTEVSYLYENYGGQIILNGLTVQENYDFMCRHIALKPYISLKSYGNSIQLNLERNRIVGGLPPVLSALQEHFIKLGLRELYESRNQFVDGQLNIRRYNCDNKYLCNIPLFFCKEGFGIYSRKTLEGIGRYKTVVMVYGYAGYPLINLNDLEENVLYLFKAELSKSEISDMIEGNIISYISKGILKAYFYDARDQYGGFKFLAMKALYKKLSGREYQGNKAAKFWPEHNKVKEEQFLHIFDEPGYIALDDTYREIFEGLKAISHPSVVRIESLTVWKYGSIRDDIDTGIIKMERQQSGGTKR